MKPVPNLLFALCAVACKGTTEPAARYPTIPPQVLGNYCIRGERAPNEPISGVLSSEDCRGPNGTFYELWRIRVQTAGTYRLEATSSFDNVLELLRLDSLTPTTATLTTIARDDDAGPQLNALIDSANLSINVDYFVLVRGFASTDAGPYEIIFTAS